MTFYEHDEPVGKIAAAFEAGTKGVTAPPSYGRTEYLSLDKLVVDDYEAQVEDLTQRLNVAAADLLETRSQRSHLARELAVAAEQAIEHAKRHAQLFDEWVRERAQLVDDGARNRLAWKSARARAWHWRERHRQRSAYGRRTMAQRREALVALQHTENALHDAQADREEARRALTEYMEGDRTALAEIYEVLTAAEAFGQSDAGAGGDVQLVIDQRNVAWRTLERVAGERDEARDEVVRLGRNLESQTSAFQVERQTLNAELVRLRTIIGELGAAEAAEPQEISREVSDA